MIYENICMLVLHDNKAKSTLKDAISNDHALSFDLYPLKFPGIFMKNISFDIEFVIE